MKKADEMEMSVNFQATRLSWAAGLFFLLVWTVTGFARTGTLPGLAFILLCLECAVFFGGKLFFTHRLVREKDDEESR
jgi:hypothetical protein